MQDDFLRVLECKSEEQDEQDHRSNSRQQFNHVNSPLLVGAIQTVWKYS